MVPGWVGMELSSTHTSQNPAWVATLCWGWDHRAPLPLHWPLTALQGASPSGCSDPALPQPYSQRPLKNHWSSHYQIRINHTLFSWVVQCHWRRTCRTGMRRDGSSEERGQDKEQRALGSRSSSTSILYLMQVPSSL